MGIAPSPVPSAGRAARGPVGCHAGGALRVGHAPSCTPTSSGTGAGGPVSFLSALGGGTGGLASRPRTLLHPAPYWTGRADRPTPIGVGGTYTRALPPDGSEALLALDSSTPTLDILYFNCRGLSATKLHSALSWAETLGAVVVLSETWFLHHAEATAHPFHVAHSLPPDLLAPRDLGHHHGGLLVLAPPAVHASTTVRLRTRYSVHLSVSGLDLAFAYHPPTSLTTPELERELGSYPRCHALIGDINVRWGRAYGDTQATHPRRRAVYLSFAERHSLALVPPVGPLVSRTDHIFSDRPDLRWTYRSGSTLDSDHGVMHARVPTRPPPDRAAPPSPPSFRYNTSLLKRDKVREALCAAFKHQSSPLLLPLLRRLSQLADSPTRPTDRPTVTALVDGVYDTWTAELHHLCTGILGTYDPSTIQFTAPDRSMSHQLETCTSADAVRLFKRAHRPTAKTTPIIARTADIQEEAHAFFTSVYSNP